jgi:hypothetical protein
MFIQLVVLNIHSPINGIICAICLIFLFFETAFGICLGCKVYPWFFKKTLQHCPGEVCAPRDRQPIQKVSIAQVLVLAGFAGFMVFLAYGLHDHLSQKPTSVLGMKTPQNSE